MPVVPESIAKGLISAADAPQTVDDYTAEVRFGVVMFGGVSLAIYINGVTNELFEMACATPRVGVLIDDADEPFTRKVYRRLSWLAGSADLRALYAKAIAAALATAEPGKVAADAWEAPDPAKYTRTRFSVDVIAGTSAGGINGVFLAKALANGQQFAPLKDLWINEGDIGLLLNDEQSYEGVSPSIDNRSSKPASLLNSDRMYAKLYYALGQMQPLAGVGRPGNTTGSPLAEEVDLFVTTTDIKGSPVALRLFDNVVYERRYKQSYHFSYPDGVTRPSGNDFDAVNTPFLAFASRCTSSFPFAFEPMTLSAVTRMKIDDGSPGVLRWNSFFPNLPRAEVSEGAHVHRAFGDGGYLDNKPFTYVVETLSKRYAAAPMERKLIFVEPSPERLDPNELPDPKHAPDALENSLAALTSIPRYETIREDLQSILLRNRRIERIERVVRLGELDVRPDDLFSVKITEDGKIPPWSTLKLSQMVDYYGTAFLPYQRLRIYSVTDRLADRMGARWDIDGNSDQQYALRALIRVWRERNFDDDGSPGKGTVNGFLDEFDIDYRLRRLSFLLRKVDQLSRLVRKRALGPLDTSSSDPKKPPALSEDERQLLKFLPSPFTGLSSDLTTDQIRGAEAILRCLKIGLMQSRAALLEAIRKIDEAPPSLDAVDTLRAELNKVLLLILGQLPADAPPEISARNAVGSIHVRLGPEALRSASATRTLQESVLFRARAVFAAADTEAATPLQTALIDGIESMRLKRGGEGEQSPGRTLHEAAVRAWYLLGSPQLVIDKDSIHVVAQVKEADARGFGDGVEQCIALLNSVDGYALRKFLGQYYLRFDTYDQMSFPLYYDTGTGEPSIVEVVRISPVDATNLINEETDPQRRRKLAGTALANFGAFLDRRWRLNDIMWGRLDGVERLIQALLPMTDADTRVVRKDLIERAQRSILRDALVPDGNATLAALLIKALDETPSQGTTAEQLRAMLSELWTGNAVARDRLGGVLVSLLDEPGLMDYVRKSRKVDPEPDPEATLKSAARAVTITGKVLEGISKKRDGGKTVPRWLARLGLMLQGIVAVSLPGTLNQRWWTHGVKVLYAFELVLVVFAVVLGSSDMRSLAITAFAATLGIHLTTLIAGDLVRERRFWLRAGVLGVLLLLIALACVGSLVLVHQGAQQQLCWEHPRHAQDKPVGSWLCAQLERVRRDRHVE